MACHDGWVSKVRYGYKPAVPAVGVCGTLRLDGWFEGGYEVRLVEVQPDEALDLADRLWGGPVVYLAPFQVQSAITRHWSTYGWTVWIRAATPEDAFHAVHDLEWLVTWGGAFPEDQIPSHGPVTGRLRWGTLADVEPWDNPGTGISLTAERA